jgi:hypothetical protein
MDTESRPVFRAGETSAVSVVQLSTASAALVAHIGASRAAGGLGALHALLRDGAVSLVGMSVEPDVRALCAAVGLPTRERACAAVELKDASMRAGVAVSGGLGKLAEALLGVRAWKVRKIQMSRWDLWPLSRAQAAYAFMDAWAGRAALLAIDALDGAPRRADAPPRPGRALGGAGAGASTGAGAAPDALDEAELARRRERLARFGAPRDGGGGA